MNQNKSNLFFLPVGSCSPALPLTAVSGCFANHLVKHSMTYTSAHFQNERLITEIHNSEIEFPDVSWADITCKKRNSGTIQGRTWAKKNGDIIRRVHLFNSFHDVVYVRFKRYRIIFIRRITHNLLHCWSFSLLYAQKPLSFDLIQRPYTKIKTSPSGLVSSRSERFSTRFFSRTKRSNSDTPKIIF